MTTYVGANEAARLLGVTKPTLYAYVSRGLVTRRTAVDGRTSLYDREQLEALAHRSPRRGTAERPSIDVRIGSAITHLDDDGLTYRDRSVAELADTCSFEQVAELLWTGELPDDEIHWPVDRNALARCRDVVAAADVRDPIVVLSLAAATLADRAEGDDAAGAARRFLAIVPSLLGGPQRGPVAGRLARAWHRSPDPALVDAIGRALVLLADHELATSTLAVRVAASVRTDAMSAVGAGLAAVRGPLHGVAGRDAATLIAEAGAMGAAAAIGRRLDEAELLPGFGHSVYRSGDPRFPLLLDAVRGLPDPSGRMADVDSVLAEAGRSVGQLPNIDLALGALVHVGGLPVDIPLFAVARVAGWVAHFVEELTARPLRYRGLATRVVGG